MTKNNRSFSSILQLSFLVFGLILAVFLTDQAQKYLGKASVSPSPKEVMMTNFSETALTVSWLTEKPSEGTVILINPPDGSKEKVYFDDRSGLYTSNSLFATHQVTLSGLTPGRPYSFFIQSGKEKYPVEYSTSTPLAAGTPPFSPVMLYGTIISQDNQPIGNVLVYLDQVSAGPVSTLTDQNGNFALNLSNRKNKDLTSWLPLSAGEKANLTVKSAVGVTLTKEIVLSDTDQNLGSLILGKNMEATGVNGNNQVSTKNLSHVSFWQKIILFFQNLLGGKK